MKEPDVALTDFLLAIECTLFAILIRRGRGDRLSGWFMAYFAAAAAAALCGGLVHGFYPAADGPAGGALWSLTLGAIGLNSVAAWAIGGLLAFPPLAARRVELAAMLLFLVYAGALMSPALPFVVAVAVAMPATLFLFGMLVWARHRHGALLAATGLVVQATAMLVQQLGVGIHSEHFNHNSVSHVVQMIAMALIFAGAVRLTRGAEISYDYAT